LCLALELEAEGEEVNTTVPDCPAALIGMEFSPAMWATMDLIDSVVATYGTGHVVAGGS
jgi:hypothetical protein